jgi:hypothetical protein
MLGPQRQLPDTIESITQESVTCMCSIIAPLPLTIIFLRKAMNLLSTQKTMVIQKGSPSDQAQYG